MINIVPKRRDEYGRFLSDLPIKRDYTEKEKLMIENFKKGVKNEYDNSIEFVNRKMGKYS